MKTTNRKIIQPQKNAFGGKYSKGLGLNERQPAALLITAAEPKQFRKMENQNYTETGIKWTSSVRYVDIDTGQLIRNIDKQKAKDYIIIKTKKHATINATNTKGNIEYTKQCRKNPQAKLFGS